MNVVKNNFIRRYFREKGVESEDHHGVIGNLEVSHVPDDRVYRACVEKERWNTKFLIPDSVDYKTFSRIMDTTLTNM